MEYSRAYMRRLKINQRSLVYFYGLYLTESAIWVIHVLHLVVLRAIQTIQ